MRPEARAESAKYLGLASMLVDHCARYLHLAAPGWATLGRLAFPCFAVALGAQVAKSDRAEVAAARCVVWGLAVAPVAWLVAGGRELDVLITLGLGVQAWVVLRRWAGAGRVAGLLLCAVGCCFSEYGPLGGLLVVSAAAGVEKPSRPEGWAVGAACVAGLAQRGGGTGVVLGAVSALALLAYGPVLPRVRRVFLGAYVVQWPLLALRVHGV